jgi:membrane protease YdiL (CAAX protease family)
MRVAAIVPAATALAVAWHLVVAGRATVWTAVTPATAAAGAVAVLVGDPAGSGAVAPGSAVVVGIATGLLLYVATRVVVGWAGPRLGLSAHAVAAYGRRGRLSLPAAVVLAALVAAPGEELFWRGLVQPELAEPLGPAGAAAAVWLAYLAVSLPSRNRAIVAGAAVGGALWAALGAWSGGVLASACSHVVWTGLMVASPVARRSSVAG